MSHTRRAFAVATLLLLPFAAAGRTQQTPQQSPFGQTRPTNSAGEDPHDPRTSDSELAAMQQRQSRLRNEERQKRLVSDTDKLLALATQLHEDVGKTDKNILSVEVVRRAEEIEKLAHSVKERMKG